MPVNGAPKEDRSQNLENMIYGLTIAGIILQAAGREYSAVLAEFLAACLVLATRA